MGGGGRVGGAFGHCRAQGKTAQFDRHRLVGVRGGQQWGRGGMKETKANCGGGEEDEEGEDDDDDDDDNDDDDVDDDDDNNEDDDDKDGNKEQG